MRKSLWVGVSLALVVIAVWLLRWPGGEAVPLEKESRGSQRQSLGTPVDVAGNERESSLGGQVVDIRGHGIAGAHVHRLLVRENSSEGLVRDGTVVSLISMGKGRQPLATEPEWAASTDSDGRFVVSGIGPGEHRFRIEASGYVAAESVAITAGDVSAVIVLEEAGTISGRVLDVESREPVAGIPLVIQPWPPHAKHGPVSDEDGQFRIEGLSAGKYTLHPADAKDYVMAKQPVAVNVKPGRVAGGVEVWVQKGGTIEGRVPDKTTGRGIEGVNIVIEGMANADCQTDSEGYYRYGGFTEREHIVMCTPPDGYFLDPSFQNRYNLSTAPGKHLTGIDFSLVPGVAVSGNVVDSQGQAVAGAEVRVRDSQDGRFGGTSDADGRFVVYLDSPKEAVYAIAVSRDCPVGCSDEIGPLSVTRNGYHGLQLKLRAGGAIRGIVLDVDGNPVPYRSISTVYEQHLIQFGDTPTNDDEGAVGCFELGGLPPATYTIEVLKPYDGYTGPVSFKQDGIRVGNQQRPSDVVIQTTWARVHAYATISGRVLDTAAQPVPGATVAAVLQNEDLDTDHGLGWAQTDKDGRYVIEGLRDGVYDAEARLDGQFSPARLTAIPAGSRDVTFQLLRAGKIEGRVVRVDTGAPVTSFEVCAVSSDSDENGLTVFTHVSHNLGRFELDGVPVGDTDLLVRADGYADIRQSVGYVENGRVISGTVVAMEDEAIAQGAVVSEDESPMSGASCAPE